MTAPTDPRTGILLFAHGARDPEWALPLQRIAAHVSAASPGLPVRLAFLEFMAPSLDAAVDAMAGEGLARITLVPLFLAQGGHLKHDLPRMLDAIRARHPAVDIRVTPAIGDSPELTAAIAGWALAQHRRGPG